MYVPPCLSKLVGLSVLQITGFFVFFFWLEGVFFFFFFLVQLDTSSAYMDGVWDTRRLARLFAASCLSCLACFTRGMGRSIRCAGAFYAGCIEDARKQLAWLDSRGGGQTPFVDPSEIWGGGGDGFFPGRNFRLYFLSFLFLLIFLYCAFGGIGLYPSLLPYAR